MALMTPTTDIDPAETARRLRNRNRAVLAVLLGLVVLFYAVSIIKMTGA
jgi:hypothetical protein